MGAAIADSFGRLPVDLSGDLAASVEDGGLPARLVAEEVRRLRVRAEARRILVAETAGLLPPFDVGTLAEVMARPAEPAARVAELIPWQASTLLTAQRKTGKTTAALNLARCLLTGEDFLGRFGVRPLDGAVCLLNYEVGPAQVARWAAEVGVPGDRLLLVNLRGRRNPLAADDDRQALAALLRAREIETLICDPFGRAYTGSDQNSAGEVGQFLARLDRFARAEVGAADLVLTAHAGWNGDRTRGSTALEDWADSIITLTRDDTENGDGARYLRAIGRDVDVDEDRLDFDTETRRLTLAGTGSRKAMGTTRRADELRAQVLRIVTLRPDVTGAEVERCLRDEGIPFQRGQDRKVLTALVESGELTCQPGRNNSKHYSVAQAAPSFPMPPHGAAYKPPQPPLHGGPCSGMARETSHPNREDPGQGASFQPHPSGLNRAAALRQGAQ